MVSGEARKPGRRRSDGNLRGATAAPLIALRGEIRAHTGDNEVLAAPGD